MVSFVASFIKRGQVGTKYVFPHYKKFIVFLADKKLQRSLLDITAPRPGSKSVDGSDCSQRLSS